MKHLFLIAALALTPYVVLYAADPDPRLAPLRTAIVVAADDLSDDKVVATCVAERIGRSTPISIVQTRQEAEMILTVSKANVSKHPKAEIAVALPDGSLLWSGGSKKRGFNLVGRNMTCVIAEDLISSLRKAMQKARERD